MEKRWIWPFELEEQIGSGAMGVVYRARFVKNDRRVALKLLPADVAANKTLAARFQREMELLKDLRHANIVHCFGGTCEGDQWFYAMELVEGGTLASLILEQGRLTWRQTVEFGLQMCAALEHAHQREIIHRDVKPGNMLITKAGKLKLSDFGLAQMQAENKLTAAGKTVGSLHYMAPEQITGKPPISHRTDLYALGCALYEMLTGRPPFIGETMAEVLQRHIRETPQPVASIALDCPPQLEALVAELLAKNADQRPADAHAVAVRLREIDQSVAVKSPKFDRNKPVSARQAETMTLDKQSSSAPEQARATNRWLVLALVAATGWGAWATFARPTSQQTDHRPHSLLADGLRDTDTKVRVFAANTLAELGPEAHEFVPALLESLKDEQPSVRAAAARALSKVGVGDESLQNRLYSVQQKDSSPRVRDAAATGIADLKKAPPPKGISTTTWVAIAVVGGVFAAGGFWIWKQFAADAAAPTSHLS